MTRRRQQVVHHPLNDVAGSTRNEQQPTDDAKTVFPSRLARWDLAPCGTISLMCHPVRFHLTWTNLHAKAGSGSTILMRGDPSGPALESGAGAGEATRLSKAIDTTAVAQMPRILAKEYRPFEWSVLEPLVFLYPFHSRLEFASSDGAIGTSSSRQPVLPTEETDPSLGTYRECSREPGIGFQSLTFLLPLDRAQT